MKLLKVIRKFERFNFQGVPEGPELSFERDNFTQVAERQTARSILAPNQDIDLRNATLIGFIIDDNQNNKEIFKLAE